MEISPSSVLKGLFGIICLLLFAHLAGLVLMHGFGHDRAYGLIALVRFDGERNLPTLFSVLQLFCASATLASIGSMVDRHRNYWFFMGVVFLFLAADEFIGFHEMLAVSRGRANPDMTLQFAWLIPYLIGASIFGLIMIPFLRSLPARTLRLFVGSGMVFVGAAVGLEAVTGLAEDAGYGVNDLPQRLVATLEEFLEMTSIAVFIYASLDFAKTNQFEVSLTLAD